MSASKNIYSKVTHVLVESLNVDEGDVTPTATLQGDLGAARSSTPGLLVMPIRPKKHATSRFKPTLSNQPARGSR